MKLLIAARRHKIIAIVLLFLILIGSLGIGYKSMRTSVDTSHPPQFIQADFVDLSKIYTISKFRSLAGHDFSAGGETCRSMKHYFTPQYDKAAQEYLNTHNWTPAKPDGKTDISIYSPVNGKIVKIVSENNSMGKQIFIAPENAKGYTIRLFHVWPKTGLKAGILLGFGGSNVKAGEQIGVIGGYQETDIAIQANDTLKGNTFISYFEAMPDALFEKYIARGVTLKSDLVLTKEYRDAHAVTCQSRSEGEQFNKPANYDYENADYVHLSGYVKVNTDGSSSL